MHSSVVQNYFLVRQRGFGVEIVLDPNIISQNCAVLPNFPFLMVFLNSSYFSACFLLDSKASETNTIWVLA